MKDKLAIIVPYRDRQEHLDVFVPHMHEFLKDKGIDYTIFIAEQSDDRPFNYGKLCNAVVKELSNDYTYFAFHDIDMLPISDECDYGYTDSPTHLATNVESHDDTLPYPQYFGGVILISREDFEKANGYSNEYWGYGFEDLDLLYRLQRSGAYLEKYQDLNQTYSRYDEDDILPYRIENVKISNTKKVNKITYSSFTKEDYIRGPLNSLSLKTLESDFFVSFWFNDNSATQNEKNIFCFEGCNSGVFLSGRKHLILQFWDIDEKHYEVSQNYFKNKWNHVIFGIVDGDMVLYLNNKKVTKSLPKSFELFNYKNRCIKISDDSSTSLISNVKIYKSKITDEVSSEIYFNGDKIEDLLQNKYGLELVNNFNYTNLYKKNLLLDGGKNLNHIQIYGTLNVNSLDINTSDDIYLPFRIQGEYKSLQHENDLNIIERYYEYNPDVEENADIFFHDVLPNELDYTEIGLSTLNCKILDKKKINNYELIRIVT
jgi:hypothetical protein